MWVHTSPNYKPLFSLLSQVAELEDANGDIVKSAG
jgi:hypothetical protein